MVCTVYCIPQHFQLPLIRSRGSNVLSHTSILLSKCDIYLLLNRVFSYSTTNHFVVQSFLKFSCPPLSKSITEAVTMKEALHALPVWQGEVLEIGCERCADRKWSS